MTQVTTAENLNKLSISEFFDYFEESLLSLLDEARVGNREAFESKRISLCEQVRSFLPDKPIDSPEIEEIITIYEALSQSSFYDLMVDNVDYLTLPQEEQ